MFHCGLPHWEVRSDALFSQLSRMHSPYKRFPQPRFLTGAIRRFTLKPGGSVLRLVSLDSAGASQPSYAKLPAL
jgi:hypothetical protein